MSITETAAKVSLQALQDHTAQRLVKLLEDVFLSLDVNYEESVKVAMFTKWGFDGTGNKSQYKQNFKVGFKIKSSLFLFHCRNVIVTFIICT